MAKSIGQFNRFMQSPFRESNEFFEAFNFNKLINDSRFTPLKPSSIANQFSSGQKQSLTPLSLLAISNIMGSPESTTVETPQAFTSDFGSRELFEDTTKKSRKNSDIWKDCPEFFNFELLRAQSSPPEFLTVDEGKSTPLPPKIEINLFDFLSSDLSKIQPSQPNSPALSAPLASRCNREAYKPINPIRIEGYLQNGKGEKLLNDLLGDLITSMASKVDKQLLNTKQHALKRTN